MNFKKMLSICKRSKAYFLYDLPDGEQMLSNGSCGYILYGHQEYTPETLRIVADLAEDDSVIMSRMPKADLPLADQCVDEEYAEPLDTCIVAAGAVWQPLVVGASMAFIDRRALQPIEKEEEGYDLYRRGDLVVVKSGHRRQALCCCHSGFAVDCTEFGGGTMTCEQCYHRDVCWHRMTIYGPYALMGINTGNMKAWCANCKPKTQIIELSMQVSQSLYDELTKHCEERVVDEL